MSHASTEPILPIDKLRVKRALISVFDKTGLEELARGLERHSVELYSTGGTEKFLREKGFKVFSVSDLTGFPEMMDGRVKTLHPMVHGGLLYRRELASHAEQARAHGIKDIDLLVLNLYPFVETVQRPGATEEEIVEQIDIGGPAMLRSAAKNFKGVAVLTSPTQYQNAIERLDAGNGELDLLTRRKLAAEAFQSVADYDVAIAEFFAAATGDRALGLDIHLPLAQPLRYGENPHQSAALYSDRFDSLFEKLWGKELSYNNLLDTSAAVGLIAEFFDSPWHVAAIIKHTNPCGVAEADTALEAFERAFTTDPESPFGGIIVFNRPIGPDVATRINEFFSEVILAPHFEDAALEILKKKKDRRLLRYDVSAVRQEVSRMREVRSVIGGILEQDVDRELYASAELRSVTSRSLETGEAEGLEFTWKVVKHVKSNAIVYGKTDGKHSWTLGIGGGQTSRVESSRIAVEKAHRLGHDLRGSLVASDAFFPFADGLVAAADAGAVAVIQPGGSVRDQEVIQAAEERHVSLVMTGMRHFKH